MNCADFGAVAEEAARILRKGLQLSMAGRLELYKFKDRDFNDRDVNKIYVSEFNNAANEDQNETEFLNDTASGNSEAI